MQISFAQFLESGDERRNGGDDRAAIECDPVLAFLPKERTEQDGVFVRRAFDARGEMPGRDEVIAAIGAERDACIADVKEENVGHF